MKTIAVVFAAALALGAAMPAAQAAQNTKMGGTSLQVQTDGLLHGSDELSARQGGKRHWRRGGRKWHGHHGWRRHGWRGHRGWHGWRGHGGAAMAGVTAIVTAGRSGITAAWCRSAAGGAGKANNARSPGHTPGLFLCRTARLALDQALGNVDVTSERLFGGVEAVEHRAQRRQPARRRIARTSASRRLSVRWLRRSRTLTRSIEAA